MIQTFSSPMTLSTPIDDSPLASTLQRSRNQLTHAESAIGRAATGLAFVGVLGATSELLGPAGLTVTCVLALLAIGAKFSAALRHQS